MRKILIADTTMTQTPARGTAALTFREKTEIARSLDRMCADIIEFAPIVNEKTDTLLGRTVASIVKFSTLSQRTGYTEESVDTAWKSLCTAERARLCVAFPVAPAQMEFVCHMKPAAVAKAIPTLIEKAKTYTSDVEFCAVDGARTVYQVTGTEVLEKNQLDALTDGEGDLTLFTCTVGGQKRVVVRCERMEEGSAV